MNPPWDLIVLAYGFYRIACVMAAAREWDMAMLALKLSMHAAAACAIYTLRNR